MNYYPKLVADDHYRIAVWWLVREARKSNCQPMKVIWGDDTFITCQVFLYVDRPYVHFSDADLKYNIPLQESSCYFGGRRHWFMCSMERDGKFCGKWVGVLYKSGNYFACRHCFNLTYRSRNDNRRSNFYSTLHFLDVDRKTIELEKQLQNRQFYAGKLTGTPFLRHCL